MEDSIDLNELLKKLQNKDELSEATSSGLKQEEESILRPIQFVCNDIIASFGNANVVEGNAQLKNYKRELYTARKKKPLTLSVFNSNADLKKLYDIQVKRLHLSNELAKECTDAVIEVKNNVKGIRKQTIDSFEKYKKQITTATDKWNRTADDISTLNNKSVKGDHMKVEKDWNRLVEVNDKIQMLSGGGPALKRLDYAKSFGAIPSESTVARAKDFDDKKILHENIHWRLRNSVESVSAKLLQKRESENERNVFNCTSDSIIRGKAKIRNAITKYNVEDSALKYEVDMLQQALMRQNVSAKTVLHNILAHIEYNDHTNRSSLSSLF
jgi:hypothetical protein